MQLFSHVFPQPQPIRWEFERAVPMMMNAAMADGGVAEAAPQAAEIPPPVGGGAPPLEKEAVE